MPFKPLGIFTFNLLLSCKLLKSAFIGTGVVLMLPKKSGTLSLSTSTFMEPTEMMCAEIVDGYLFAFVEDDDKNKVFLTQTDLKIKANSTENSKTIDVEAETDDVEAEADED